MCYIDLQDAITGMPLAVVAGISNRDAQGIGLGTALHPNPIPRACEAMHAFGDRRPRARKSAGALA